MMEFIYFSKKKEKQFQRLIVVEKCKIEYLYILYKKRRKRKGILAA